MDEGMKTQTSGTKLEEDTKVSYSDLPSPKDLRPSYVKCGQLIVSSC